MKVELLKPIPGKAYFEGDVIELADDQARKWIESGHCVAAKVVAPPVEELTEDAGDQSDQSGGADDETTTAETEVDESATAEAEADKVETAESGAALSAETAESVVKGKKKGKKN